MKKKIQMIWQAGLEDFTARRDRAAQLRAGVPQEPAASPRRRALDRTMEEHVRRAVAAATAPLRQEIDALKEEVAALREQAGRARKGR